ncbi:MAG: EamA family transporter [Kiritimatiellae bacterium]|nr:EamA family transporter [Kiritimatiellia bacterium]
MLPIGAGICWGLIGPFVRHLDAAGLTGMEIIAVRSAVTALALFPWMAIRRPAALRVRPRDIWCFLGTGIGSIVFFNWCYFATITAASLSVACTLMYGAPAFVLLMSALFFRERLTRRKLAVCILAFLGCALVSGWLAPGRATARIPAAALLTGLGSAFGYALYSIFGRCAAARGYSTATITAWTFLVAALGAIPFLRPGTLAAAYRAAPALWGWSLALGLLVTLLPYLLYSAALRRMETGRASLLSSIEPVVATLVGLLLYREPLTLPIALGIALVLFALSLLPRR